MRQSQKHSERRAPAWRWLGLAATLCTILPGQAGAANIIFAGGAPGETHFQSDGVTGIPTDAGFEFQLGTFVDDFDPAANPVEEWLSNWSGVTDAAGNPHPDATTEFTSLPAPLFGNYDGYNSEVELTHNNAPFTSGKRAYIWGYNKARDEPGNAQWILITNSDDWLFPNTKSDLGFSATWDLAAATPGETLVGSLTTDGSAIMTFGNVTIPAAVPEPSAAGFALLTLALGSLRRRRTLHDS